MADEDVGNLIGRIILEDSFSSPLSAASAAVANFGKEMEVVAGSSVLPLTAAMNAVSSSTSAYITTTTAAASATSALDTAQRQAITAFSALNTAEAELVRVTYAATSAFNAEVAAEEALVAARNRQSSTTAQLTALEDGLIAATNQVAVAENNQRAAAEAVAKAEQNVASATAAVNSARVTAVGAQNAASNATKTATVAQLQFNNATNAGVPLLTATTTGTNAVTAATNALAPAAANAAKSVQVLTSSLDDNLKQARLVSRDFVQAGAALSMYLTAPIVGLGLASLKAAMNFETAMVKIIKLAGASRAEVASLTEEVLKLAKESGVAPVELAKGLFVVESAAYRGTKAIEVLGIAAKMSALGMGSMEEVSRALVGKMFAFQEAGLTAARTADILTIAVQLGNSSIGAMVPALARVNPIAAVLGISFEEVAASVATFTHMGADAAVAATGLRGLLTNMVKESDQTTKGFLALARTTGDFTITMQNFRQEMKDVGMTQAFINLLKHVKDAGEEGIDAIAQIIPNVRALTFALGDFAIQGDFVQNTLQQMRDRTGVLDQATQELQKTMQWKWDQLKIELNEVAISFGLKLFPAVQKLIPFISDLLDKIANLITWFGSLNTVSQYAILGFFGITAALGPLVFTIGEFMRVSIAAGEGMSTLIKWINGTTAATNALTAAKIASNAVPLAGAAAGAVAGAAAGAVPGVVAGATAGAGLGAATAATTTLATQAAVATPILAAMGAALATWGVSATAAVYGFGTASISLGALIPSFAGFGALLAGIGTALLPIGVVLGALTIAFVGISTAVKAGGLIFDIYNNHVNNAEQGLKNIESEVRLVAEANQYLKDKLGDQAATIQTVQGAYIVLEQKHKEMRESYAKNTDAVNAAIAAEKSAAAEYVRYAEDKVKTAQMATSEINALYEQTLAYQAANAESDAKETERIVAANKAKVDVLNVTQAEIASLSEYEKNQIAISDKLGVSTEFLAGRFQISTNAIELYRATVINTTPEMGKFDTELKNAIEVIEGLTASQKRNIEAALKLGHSVLEVSKGMKITEGAVALYADQLRAHEILAKKDAKAIAEIDSAGKDYLDTLSKMTDEQVKEIQLLLEAGISHGAIQAALEKTAVQVDSVAEKMKVYEKALKASAKAAKETANLEAEIAAVRSEMSGNDLTISLANIERRRTAEINALRESGEDLARNADLVNQKWDLIAENAGINFGEILANSQEGAMAMAENMRRQYEAMTSSGNTYTQEYKAQQLLRVTTAEEAARKTGSSVDTVTEALDRVSTSGKKATDQIRTLGGELISAAEYWARQHSGGAYEIQMLSDEEISQAGGYKGILKEIADLESNLANIRIIGYDSYKNSLDMKDHLIALKSSLARAKDMYDQFLADKKTSEEAMAESRAQQQAVLMENDKSRTSAGLGIMLDMWKGHYTALGQLAAGTYKEIGSMISQVGGITLKFDIGSRAKTPAFGGGVENFSGGTALVGERGPELVNLPAGSDVIPNGSFGAVTNNIYVNGTAEDVARKVAFEIMKTVRVGRQFGTV